MASTPSFHNLMMRVRARDAGAAEQLVRQHEQSIRVAVRVRLTDLRLRRQFDSMDVCQSVFHSFFVRAAAGQFDLDDPQKLVGLLMKMARNKLLMQVRHHRAQGRDVRKVAIADDEIAPAADPAPGPDRQAAGRDLLEQLLARLDVPERELAKRRAKGMGWKEIAQELGGTPQAHRMRLSRAINEVATDLGLDEGFGDGD